MGAFLSSLGFNQPFFLTVIGIFLMLSVTIFIAQDASGNDDESLREERVLLGMYKNRKIGLHRPSDLPRSPTSSLRGMNSTHLA
uniref:Uncharacterized protein n=1 Tax=Panagrellus redivivus TaxID=6233 RepID=A0A7E4VIA8_PANRE